jgi:sarcosine oxidase subunit beta
MERSDVVVIGGGVYGASIAWQLARLGRPPVLLERAALGSGPTGRSSANVRVHYLLRELAELTRRSMTILRSFRERTGADAGLVETGFVFLLGAEDAARWGANAEALRTAGFELEVRAPGELLDLLPGMDLADVRLAIVEPRGGYADPVAVTTGMADAARRLGAGIRQGSPVRRIILERGRVAGVELASGERVMSERVVVAAGPWSRDLLSDVGLDLPLHAERHPVAVIDAPGRARSILPVVLADVARDYYARPDGADTIILGSRDRYPPVPDLEAFDEVVGLDEGGELVSRAAARIAGLEALGVRGGWAGLYDCTPDRLPIVDRAPGVDGLFVCCGTSGHGFKMAPALGEQAARLALDLPTELLAPFSIGRDFAGGGRDLGGIVHRRPAAGARLAGVRR